MTNTAVIYALPTDGLKTLHDAQECVREDDPAKTMDLVDYNEAITERLRKVQALIQLLINEDIYRDDDMPDAIWAIMDLLKEAKNLYDRQWSVVKTHIRPLSQIKG